MITAETLNQCRREGMCRTSTVKGLTLSAFYLDSGEFVVMHGTRQISDLTTAEEAAKAYNKALLGSEPQPIGETS